MSEVSGGKTKSSGGRSREAGGGAIIVDRHLVSVQKKSKDLSTAGNVEPNASFIV